MARGFFLLFVLCAAIGVAQNAGKPVVSGVRYSRWVRRNGTIMEGNGTPAGGPKDIVIENNVIRQIVAGDAVSLGEGNKKRPTGDAVIDAAGKYVMPGLINLHGHVQDERGGIPMPLEYNLKLWLACGITTVRDVGSDTRKTIKLRAASAEGQVAAPRLFIYPVFNRDPNPRNAEEARARLRDIKALA